MMVWRRFLSVAKTHKRDAESVTPTFGDESPWPGSVALDADQLALAHHVPALAVLGQVQA
jgi:hypothetical protein